MIYHYNDGVNKIHYLFILTIVNIVVVVLLLCYYFEKN